MSRTTGKWDKVLNLKDIWDRNIPESDMPELGKIIAKRLRRLYSEEFLQLYDWADYDKRLWIDINYI